MRKTKDADKAGKTEYEVELFLGRDFNVDAFIERFDVVIVDTLGEAQKIPKARGADLAYMKKRIGTFSYDPDFYGDWTPERGWHFECNYERVVTLDVRIVEEYPGVAPDDYAIATAIEQSLPDEWFDDPPDGWGIAMIYPKGWYREERYWKEEGE